jgi:hypothetical protein
MCRSRSQGGRRCNGSGAHTFTGPVSFGGRASDGDINITEDTSETAGDYADDVAAGAADFAADVMDQMRDAVAGPVTFMPGSVVSYGGHAAGGRVNEYYEDE